MEIYTLKFLYNITLNRESYRRGWWINAISLLNFFFSSTQWPQSRHKWKYLFLLFKSLYQNSNSLLFSLSFYLNPDTMFCDVTMKHYSGVPRCCWGHWFRWPPLDHPSKPRDYNSKARGKCHYNRWPPQRERSYRCHCVDWRIHCGLLHHRVRREVRLLPEKAQVKTRKWCLVM